MTFGDLLNEMKWNVTQTDEMLLTKNITALFFALLVGVYLFVVYRVFVRKTLYNVNLNISLVGMTVILTAIMLTIQSNLILSLGMVGALSIVRYRTAVKDPMDLFFLFWAIAGGIMCGAGQYALVLGVTLVLTVVVFILAQIPTLKAPYILVINGSYEGLEDAVMPILEKYSRYYKVKSRSIINDTERMIIELKVKKEKELMEELHLIKAVEKLSILTYEGDVVC